MYLHTCGRDVSTDGDEDRNEEDGEIIVVEDGDRVVEDGGRVVEVGDRVVEVGDRVVENGDRVVEDGDRVVKDGDAVICTEDVVLLQSHHCSLILPLLQKQHSIIIVSDLVYVLN